MVVSWNENPTRSSASTMRLDSQLPLLPLMWRSVSVISAVERTIMRCLLGGDGWGSGVLGGQHVVDGLVADLDAAVALLVRQGERRQELDHLVARAGGLDQQLVVEAPLHGLVGELRVVDEGDAERHPAPAQLELALVLVDQRREPLPQDPAVLEGLVLELVVGPELAQGQLGGHERHVVTAERAVVLARRPGVEVLTEQ